MNNPTIVSVSCGHEIYCFGNPPKVGEYQLCEQCHRNVPVLATRQAKTVELPPALKEFIKEKSNG